MTTDRSTPGRSKPDRSTPDRSTPNGLQAHLLDHTLRVLLRDGSSRFSMNAVAVSAKASKETLYRHFGDKAGLLHAALARSADLIGPLLLDGLDSTASPVERLRRLGLNYLRGYFLPEAVALRRITYADDEHGLGPLFVTVVTDRAVDIVEAEFAALGSEWPRADAETFLGMIQGKVNERIMLGMAVDDHERRMEAQVDHALRVIGPYVQSLRGRPPTSS